MCIEDWLWWLGPAPEHAQSQTHGSIRGRALATKRLRSGASMLYSLDTFDTKLAKRPRLNSKGFQNRFAHIQIRLYLHQGVKCQVQKKVLKCKRVQKNRQESKESWLPTGPASITSLWPRERTRVCGDFFLLLIICEYECARACVLWWCLGGYSLRSQSNLVVRISDCPFSLEINCSCHYLSSCCATLLPNCFGE